MAALTVMLLLSGPRLWPSAQNGRPVEGDSFSVELPSGFHPAALVAADFTGDRDADVALCGGTGALLVLAGDGRGGLRPIMEDGQHLCGEHPFGITAADLNGDGRIDIAVANHDTQYVTVLTNRGGGRFSSNRVPVRSNPHPHMIAAADVNGDGLADLVTDSWGDRRLLWLPAVPGGWQSPGVPIDAGRGPYVNVVAADLDGDGRADLAFPNAVPTSPAQTVSVLVGDGRGNFRSAPGSPVIAGPAPFMIALGDVNGDGLPDVLVANYSGHISDTSKDGLTWMRNDGGGRFSAFAEPVARGQGTWAVASGDLNGDHFDDAAFINAAGDTVTLAYGAPTGLTAGGSVRVMPEPHRLAIADLRADGHASILVTTEELDQLRVVSIR